MAVGNVAASIPAPAIAMGDAAASTPDAVPVPGTDAPLRTINGQELKRLAGQLGNLFSQYKSDRQVQEQRWLRNLRQYLGLYDPEVERLMSLTRSKAYPRITRVKCLSLKARLMDLMFPSDDCNWTLKASASHEMSADDVKTAIATAQQLDTASGQQPTVDQSYVMAAVQQLADDRAKELTTLINDQLQELGGDQTYDYVALNSQIVQSGIIFGLGTLLGPFLRTETTTTWQLDPDTNQPMPRQVTLYYPQFEFQRVWDYYPDMAAKRLEEGDGYFLRKVMSKHQLRQLGKRQDFMADQIKEYLKASPRGNYTALTFESELRVMGTKLNVNEQKADTTKYEVVVWRGPVDGHFLRSAGVEVAEAKVQEEIDAEVWMVDGWVIKAVMNPWVEMGVDLRTVHHFLFDEDDTSPIGFGLPNVLRDTQMAISAATRMMLDNASVICGPILEMNTSLLKADQDLTAITAYKIFYRDDDGLTSQYPAVRDLKIESHIAELQGIIKFFMDLSDIESFVSVANGGDVGQMPSEPMRNAAGASMLLGRQALPFKEIVRNFDRLTMSVIQSLVAFNRKFNPDKAKVAAYDVIARGATSLIAKELRGMQIDSLAQTLTPEEKLHVDMRKMAIARFAVRDLTDMLVSEQEAGRRQAAQDATAAAAQKTQQDMAEATIRNTLAQAFKNIAQGQKNQMGANAAAVSAALEVLEHGLHGDGNQSPGDDRTAQGGGSPPAPGDPRPGERPPALPPPGAGVGMVPPGAGATGELPVGGLGQAPGLGGGLQ